MFQKKFPCRKFFWFFSFKKRTEKRQTQTNSQTNSYKFDEESTAEKEPQRVMSESSAGKR